jgi:hypothetical protein
MLCACSGGRGAVAACCVLAVVVEEQWLHVYLRWASGGLEIHRGDPLRTCLQMLWHWPCTTVLQRCAQTALAGRCWCCGLRCCQCATVLCAHRSVWHMPPSRCPQGSLMPSCDCLL